MKKRETNKDDALESIELANEDERPSSRRSHLEDEQVDNDELRAEFSELSMGVEEEAESDQNEPTVGEPTRPRIDDTFKPPIRRRLVGSVSSRGRQHESFWGRMSMSPPVIDKKKRRKNDPYFDYTEGGQALLTFRTSDAGEIKVDVPSLIACQHLLQNEEAEVHRRRSVKWRWRLADTGMNALAAIYIYLTNIFGVESVLVILNTALATYYFCRNAKRYAVKLDFAFLALAVVFPLTFLIQSTFGRRDLALQRLADFKAALLSAALFTLTVDWSAKNGDPVGGRLELPSHFNSNVLKDFQELLQLVYEYLSMPSVSHARHIVFFYKQRATKRVHALQNDLVKRINDSMFDMMMHTEEMRNAGFPSGEASRLHQYHQYLQQRFEQLRILKYYRTPQATRSFGRAYIFILPWLCGPYFAWVFIEGTGYAYSISLAVFTFLILLGLLNTQQGLEDPFLADSRSWTPGIDSVKLDFELAVALQAICQYYANAELQRRWEMERGANKRGCDTYGYMREQAVLLLAVIAASRSTPKHN